MRLLNSNSLSPFENIALEESLLAEAAEEPVLLFWQSESAVVLGKNQNPWREVNLAYCREHDIAIARRFTGGGCVYQDAGNLNYALILPRDGYCMPHILDGIAETMTLGSLPAERIMDNSLALDGQKFSGHAFCYRKSKVLHHGTLLIHADLEHLQASLRPDGPALDSHAVASRPASVCNLSDYGVDDRRARQMVIQGLEKVLGERCGIPEALRPEFFHGLESASKFASKDWIWGQTPAFSVDGESKGQPFSLKIRKMKIESVSGLDDAGSLLGQSLLEELPANMPVVLREAIEPFCV